MLGVGQTERKRNDKQKSQQSGTSGPAEKGSCLLVESNGFECWLESENSQNLSIFWNWIIVIKSYCIDIYIAQNCHNITAKPAKEENYKIIYIYIYVHSIVQFPIKTNIQKTSNYWNLQSTSREETRPPSYSLIIPLVLEVQQKT